MKIRKYTAGIVLVLLFGMAIWSASIRLNSLSVDAAIEQRVLTAMAQNTPVYFRHEPFKVLQYDVETRKVTLKGRENGVIVVKISKLD